VGLWKTIDDKSGEPGGLIRIVLIYGQYQAKIEKIFPDPGEHPIQSASSVKGRVSTSR
jgi:hypothetical protein